MKKALEKLLQRKEDTMNKIREIVRKILENESIIFNIGFLEMENEEEIEKRLKTIKRKLRKLEKRVECEILPIKLEERLVKKIIEIEKERDLLMAKLKELREKKRKITEKMVAKKAIKLLKKSFMRHLKRYIRLLEKEEKLRRRIEEKERLIKGITVYKEETSMRELKKRAREILKKIKEGGKLTVDELLTLKLWKGAVRLSTKRRTKSRK